MQREKSSPQGETQAQQTTVEKFSAMALAIVPQGKAIAWLAGAAVVVFLAGYGSALRFSQYRELPAALARIDSAHAARLDALRADVARVRTMADANTSSIGTTRQELQAAARSNQRILCLVEIAVEGERLTPFEYNRRCPTAGGGA